MDVEIRNRPAFTNLLVKLNAGEKILVEASAMASMTSSIEMTTRLNGGFFGGMARKYLGSESMFINEFTTMTAGELVLTQAYPGDMMCFDLKGTTMYLQPGAFIACEPSVSLSLGWAGVSSFVGGEGMFRLKVSGVGRVWFGAYGGLFEREIVGE
ncbi:MAG TPA: TIGR00266 family protein, partial [Pirellulales bacterium]